MNRLGNKIFSSVLSFAVATSLAACGGGGSHVSALPQAQPTTSSASYTGPLADATFKVTIPVPSTTSAQARQPSYVSASTAKVVFTLNSDTVGLSGAALATYNTNNLGAMAVMLHSTQCPGTGPWTCTFTIKIPPGTDNVTMSAQDSSNNVLSQQTQNFTVVVATANSFNVTLDAQVFTMALQAFPTVPFFAGPLSGAIPNGANLAILSPPSSGSNSQQFKVVVKDKQGNSIIGPGLPTMTVTTANNTDITVSNVVQESNDGTTVYSFILNASAASASVNSTTPTDVTVKFTGANAPTDGITVVSQTFHVSNAKLIAVSGGSPSQITLYAYGDGQFVQFGSTITSAGSLGGHNASQVVFDNAEDLFVADAGNGSASAVFRIPRGQLQQATPAATQITAPGGNPKKLEPWYLNSIDVSGDGTVAVAQNSNNFSDPASGGTAANQPDTILIAAAGSSTFTLGWNNIGAFVSSGSLEQAAAMSIAVMTDSTHTTPFGYASPMFSNPVTNPSQLGYLAVVYPVATTGASTVTCDTASATTNCFEMDSTSNVDVVNIAWDVWDYANQKLAFNNNDMSTGHTTYKLLDFPLAGANQLSSTSSVVDTIDTTSAQGKPYQLATSPHGFVVSAYGGPASGNQINVYNNGSGGKVLNAYGDTPSINAVGFVSDTTRDALVVLGTDALTGGNHVLRVYQLNTGLQTAARNASLTLPFTPVDVAVAAQSHGHRFLHRRGEQP